MPGTCGCTSQSIAPRPLTSTFEPPQVRRQRAISPPSSLPRRPAADNRRPLFRCGRASGYNPRGLGSVGKKQGEPSCPMRRRRRSCCSGPRRRSWRARCCARGRSPASSTAAMFATSGSGAGRRSGRSRSSSATRTGGPTTRPSRTSRSARGRTTSRSATRRSARMRARSFVTARGSRGQPTAG